MASSEATLRWTGEDLIFRGTADGGPEVTVDSEGSEGPSPMQSLLLSLAGCMAIDVVMILRKGRVPFDDLEVSIEGDRAEDSPRYFHSIRMRYRVSGPREEHEGKLERAVSLSRDKYCSVLHTLRKDLKVSTEIERV